MQDSAPSANSIRRRSSIAPLQETSKSQSKSPDQVDEAVRNPTGLRDPGQQKQWRSSLTSTSDETIASTIYSSDSEHGDEVINEQIIEDDGSDSSESDDGTMVTVDDVTGTSVVSGQTINSEMSDDIEEALRLARQTARSNAAMPDDDEEVIPGLIGWGKNTNQQPTAIRHSKGIPTALQPSNEEEPMEMTMDMDMDMTKPLGGIIGITRSDRNETIDEMSMDVTSAIGGILSQARNQTEHLKFTVQSGNETIIDDEVMEMTMAIGGIRPAQSCHVDDTVVELDDENMSMEMTKVMGRVLQTNENEIVSSLQSRRQTTAQSVVDDEDGIQMDMTMEAPMDMTVGLGCILPASSNYQSESEVTMPMEVTMAVGGILSQSQDTPPRHVAKQMMVEEADHGDDFLLNSSPFKNSPSPRKPPAPNVFKEDDTTGISAFCEKGIRRSLPSARTSLSPGLKSSSKQLTPTTSQPKPTRVSLSPKKTPRNSASPQKQISLTRNPSKAKSPRKSLRIFEKNDSTGVNTPRIVLDPRRMTGVGADRPGLGSPKVSQLLDRRSSIGNSADSFSPIQLRKRGVAFGDPQIVELEDDKEYLEDIERENTQNITEDVVESKNSGRDVTLSLKEMIQSLSPSPKFQPLRGRKSLAVGSAAGLLGKRPVELDDSDDEDNEGIKRLKGHQGSPVKNIRLKQPPSKSETTGHLTRSIDRKSPDFSCSNIAAPSIRLSPVENSKAKTSRDESRYQDAADDPMSVGVQIDERKPEIDDTSIQSSYQEEDSAERIHLQEFLDMTSIRFMELNTTKRRVTTAPETFSNRSHNEDDKNSLFERCVVAGACTLPMVELYQHSCHELKKYIHEGRKIVREIEAETFDVNPPLFREYMSASPDVKTLMDNQFKNVKTHARLQSKAMWYEWRMKLQEGLKEGLLQTSAGMDKDEKLLDKQQVLLDSALPALREKHVHLEQHHKNLEQYAEELASCDPEELNKARNDLIGLDREIEEKKKLISLLRLEVEESSTQIDALKIQKEHCLSNIQEAERIREDCRGWSTDDISTHKSRVEAIEKKYGWSITAVRDSVVSMTYKKDIEVTFDTAEFSHSIGATYSSASVQVHYVGDQRERAPQPFSKEREFFVDFIQQHIAQPNILSQRKKKDTHRRIKDFLDSISVAWDTCLGVTRNVLLLNTIFPTTVERTHLDGIVVRCVLMVKPVRTKVEVSLTLKKEINAGKQSQIQLEFHSAARVVYGEMFNERKMDEFLKTKLKDPDDDDGERQRDGPLSWADVLVELHERLVARGKKG